MQERQVTVDGRTYPLDRPFITIATQNPLEQEGTYPLPEAQLDRFMFKLLVGYPTNPEEQNILQHYADGRDVRDLSRFNLATVLSGSQVLDVQQACNSVIVEASIINYITAIVGRTRNWHSVSVGASPRAGVNILLAARAMAACHGRNFVIPTTSKNSPRGCSATDCGSVPKPRSRGSHRTTRSVRFWMLWRPRANDAALATVRALRGRRNRARLSARRRAVRRSVAGDLPLRADTWEFR